MRERQTAYDARVPAGCEDTAGPSAAQIPADRRDSVPAMDPFRLTGFVYPVKKNGVPVRGRWQLWVNLPPSLRSTGTASRSRTPKGSRSRSTRRPPRWSRRRARRPPSDLLEDMDRGARVPSHHRPRPPPVGGALGPLARGDPRRDARRQLQLLPAIRRIHVDPALGQVLAGKLTRAQLSTSYAAKLRGRREAPGRDHRRPPPPRDAQDRLQLGARGGAAPREPALRVKNPPALRPKTRPSGAWGRSRAR